MAGELRHAVFVSTGNLIAPRGGSELRTATLAREFAAAGVRTEIWCYVARNYPAVTREIAPGLLVKQRHLAWLDAALVASKLGCSHITNLAAWLKHARGKFEREIHEIGPDVVVFTFPWFATWQESLRNIPCVYDAHNVETQYWQTELMPKGKWPNDTVLKTEANKAEKTLERLGTWERRAVAACDRLVACTEADARHFVEVLGPGNEKVAVVPNGFDAGRIPVIDAEARAQARRELGIAESERMALFMGRGTGPNKDAVGRIVGLMPKLEGARVRVFVVGHAGDEFKDHAAGGLMVTGGVESMKQYLQAADVGINPMASGSGSNLKLAEFAAAGLEIVTTEFGLRGYEDWREHVTVAESPEEWVAALRSGSTGRKVPKGALEQYSWEKIAERMMEACREIIR